MRVPSPVVVIVVAFVATCCVVDIRTRRIPNYLSAPVLLAGLIMNAAWLGMPGLLQSVLGMLLVAAVLIGPFAFGGVGGGDVKMMAAIGALLGPRLGLASLGTGMALGGVIMVIHLIRLGRLREKLKATGRMIWASLVTQSLAPLRAPTADNAGAVALPYSVPLGLGTVAVLSLAIRG